MQITLSPVSGESLSRSFSLPYLFAFAPSNTLDWKRDIAQGRSSQKLAFLSEAISHAMAQMLHSDQDLAALDIEPFFAVDAAYHRVC